MRLISWLTGQVPLSAILAVGLSCLVGLVTLVAPGSVWAGGPVAPESLPGGVIVVDDDPGSGEQWGRPGGRSIQFTVNNPGDFTALSWGVAGGTLPGTAFDGSIGPGELLAFNGAQSILAGGVARWTGAAQIELVDTSPSTFPVLETRFTLTVTNGGGPVPLGFVAGEVNPGIDVKSAGPFTANLFFETLYPSSIGGDDTWRPTLDLFDLLDTDPAGGGVLAQTSLSTGFYFPAEEGLTLEDHDANISAQIDSVKGDTAFLRIDTVGRFEGLSGDLATVSGDLAMVKSQVSAIPTTDLSQDLNTLIGLHQQGGENGATQEDVQAAKDELTDILLILFGLAPCPVEAGPLCETATFIDDLATQANLDMLKDEVPAIQDKLDAIQDALASVPQGGELRVEVIEISDRSTGNRGQWLVKTTRDGSLVDAELTRLLEIRATSGEAPATVDVTALVTATQLVTGLQEVFLEIAAGVSDTHAYQFDLHLGGDIPADGSALVDRSLPVPAAR